MSEPEERKLAVLAAKAAAGDWQAFAELAEVLWRDAYLIAFAVLGDHEDAQDAAQQAMLNIGRNLWQFNASKGSFRVWFKIISRNAAISIGRKRKRNSEFLSLDAPISEDGNLSLGDQLEDEAASAQFEANVDSANVRSLVEKLDPRLRLVVTLLYLEGDDDDQSLDAVARVLEVTPQRVGQLRRIAFDQLRNFEHPEKSKTI